MRDYTRNQMDHFRQQLQLLILGKGLTRKELSKKIEQKSKYNSAVDHKQKYKTSSCPRIMQILQY